MGCPTCMTVFGDKVKSFTKSAWFSQAGVGELEGVALLSLPRFGDIEGSGVDVGTCVGIFTAVGGGWVGTGVPRSTFKFKMRTTSRVGSNMPGVA